MASDLFSFFNPVLLVNVVYRIIYVEFASRRDQIRDACLFFERSISVPYMLYTI